MQSKGLWFGHSCASNKLHTAERSVTLYASSSELFTASKSCECFIKALGETSILLRQRNRVKLRYRSGSADAKQDRRRRKPGEKTSLTSSKVGIMKQRRERHEKYLKTVLKRCVCGGEATCESLGFFLASLFPSLQLFCGTW